MRNLLVNAYLVCSADATYVSLCHKGWTIRKVVAGWRIFELHEFSSLTFPYFLVVNFPLHEYIFCTVSAPYIF